MPKYKPNIIQYPQELTEYQIVTSTGRASRIFEEFHMARDYVRRNQLPVGWKLIMVKTVKYEMCDLIQLAA